MPEVLGIRAPHKPVKIFLACLLVLFCNLWLVKDSDARDPTSGPQKLIAYEPETIYLSPEQASFWNRLTESIHERNGTLHDALLSMHMIKPQDLPEILANPERHVYSLALLNLVSSGKLTEFLIEKPNESAEIHILLPEICISDSSVVKSWGGGRLIVGADNSSIGSAILPQGAHSRSYSLEHRRDARIDFTDSGCVWSITVNQSL